MKNLENVADKNYLLSVNRIYKDRFFVEVKARNMQNGKMYDVRFKKKNEFLFFIYEHFVWKIYLLHSNAKYHSESFRSISKFEELEYDINHNVERPLLFIRNGKTIKSSLHKHMDCPKTPSFPFYFPREVRKLDLYESRCRYQYRSAPKFLIIARMKRSGRTVSENSYYVFGCNDKELFNKIQAEQSIIVTNTYEKIKAVAVQKIENEYHIIPRQHCMGVA